MVIPATNFTATFSKIGYLGIKRILYKGKVNYSRISIVQASDLKERLEELKIKRDEVKIASVDAINMYPSIKLSTIRKALIFFAIKLTAATKEKYQTMPGTHPLRNVFNPHIFCRPLLRVSWRRNIRTRVRNWWI